jgi:hypothetical protein
MSGKPHVSKTALKTFLHQLEYPVSYLDFETFGTAIPLFDRTRPYEQVPFQFSLHVVGSPGSQPKHHMFLADARCALLHTHTASSKLSRAGKARELHYYRSYGRPVPPAMQTALGSLSPKGKQFLDLDAMHGAFVDGTRRLIGAIQRDPALEKRVLHHSRMLLGSWSSPA